MNPSLPNDIREKGWMVAVHNDYRLNGVFHTFWLFTHEDGTYVRGEGKSDEEALDSIRRQLRGTDLSIGDIVELVEERLSESGWNANIGMKGKIVWCNGQRDEPDLFLCDVEFENGKRENNLSQRYIKKVK